MLQLLDEHNIASVIPSASHQGEVILNELSKLISDSLVSAVTCSTSYAEPTMILFDYVDTRSKPSRKEKNHDVVMISYPAPSGFQPFFLHTPYKHSGPDRREKKGSVVLAFKYAPMHMPDML